MSVPVVTPLPLRGGNGFYVISHFDQWVRAEVLSGLLNQGAGHCDGCWGAPPVLGMRPACTCLYDVYNWRRTVPELGGKNETSFSAYELGEIGKNTLKAMNNADFVVALINRASWGAAMEMLWATKQNKPLFILATTEEAKKLALVPFLAGNDKVRILTSKAWDDTNHLLTDKYFHLATSPAPLPSDPSSRVLSSICLEEATRQVPTLSRLATALQQLLTKDSTILTVDGDQFQKAVIRAPQIQAFEFELPTFKEFTATLPKW